MPTTPPIIPFEFTDPPSEKYEEHLSFLRHEGEDTVSWAPAGVTITVPISVLGADPVIELPPDRSEIEEANLGLVKFHGDTGYSVGAFHEYLVNLRGVPYDGFRMGHIEVTFGQATPLIAYLFSGLYRWKYYGPWDDLHSARIVGANDMHEVELALTNALIRYDKRHSYVPSFYEMNIDEYVQEDPESEPPHATGVLVDGPVIRDMEPVRFLHRGLVQTDAAAASVYFYRVLEFYAFSSMSADFAKVRHDKAISDEAFPAEMLRMFSRDEKGPLLKLVNQLAGKTILKEAVASGLIQNENSSLLGERLYAFRNSIVHGKNTSAHELHSPSLFEEQSTSKAWKGILRALAQTAIERFGRKLL